MTQDKNADNLAEQPLEENQEKAAEKIVPAAGEEASPADEPEKPQDEAAKELQALQDQLAAKDKALNEVSDKYMRLAAEYDNFRRRSQKEKESIHADAVADVVGKWLPVLDDLDRAQLVSDQYSSEEARKVCEGILMIQKQVHSVLQQFGVSEIDCLDQSFDPQLQEAVMHVDDENAPPSTVVEVLRKGYRLGDRVIRHAMVKVAN